MSMENSDEPKHIAASEPEIAGFTFSSFCVRTAALNNEDEEYGEDNFPLGTLRPPCSNALESQNMPALGDWAAQGATAAVAAAAP